MSTIEKTCVLWLYESRLLIRDRRRLLGLICLPLIGAVFFGLAGRSGAQSVAPHGLFLVLLISALPMVQLGMSAQMLRHLPGYCGGPSPVHVSRALTALLVLAIQAALYVAVIGLLQPELVPGWGVYAAALASSLVVAVTSQLLRPSR